ncbi:gamma-tubulin complex component 3 homolog [Oscarella lobularis]|uniref:gamma-tubulin complex component 3 homolog n=1 Tax=Oscarella lobularis TaxID=121494 RepID=UPI003313EC65
MSVQHSGGVTELVFSLCQHFGSAKNDPSRLYQRSLRLLASKTTLSVTEDEFRIVERIQKRLARRRSVSEAAKFSELCKRLESPVKQSGLKHRWAVLYLLFLISEDRNDAREGFVLKSASPSPSLSSVSSRSTSGVSSFTSQSSTRPGSAPATRTGTGLGGSLFQSMTMTTSGARPLHSTPIGANDGAPLAFSIPSTLQQKNQTTLQKRTDETTNTLYELSEATLVRDVIFVIQGIDGQHVKFDVSCDAYVIDSKIGVLQAVRDQVSKIAELGWLYKKVRSYVDTHVRDKALGLVGQSFCAALSEELTEYYRLVAVLDSQRVAGKGVGDALTLRRLIVWTLDPLRRLRTLASLVDSCQGLKGGALCSAVHAHLHSGDPFVVALVRQILYQVARPIRCLLDQWIYEGELRDVYDEFFVLCDDAVAEDKLWREKYAIRKSMLPSFVPEELAQKILLIGKSIDFIRRVCRDRSPIGTTSTGTTTRDDAVATVELTFGDVPGSPLHQSIDLAYRETSKRLIEILYTKYNFLGHLKAMRRYLLMGQGDFIRHLMDLLEPELEQDAGHLYLHNLSGTLESAVRATNAQFDDSDILERLDVRLLELSAGDTGWDVFSLDYHVDGPIQTVFTHETVLRYLRIFNFLWRAKRMEHGLASVWKAQMTRTRQIRWLTELSGVLHLCYTLGASMMNFVNQMQYYITFEVLECGWADLEKAVSRASDLDQIIAAHDVFLDDVTARALLGPGSQSKILLRQLRTVFDLIVQYQREQEEVFAAATTEAERRRRMAKDTQEAANQFVEEDVYRMSARLGILSNSYQGAVEKFLACLDDHDDVNLKFLSFRLNFNEHYDRAKLLSEISSTHSRGDGEGQQKN